jgi:hypothetical protein
MIPFLMEREGLSEDWATPKKDADEMAMADKIVFPANSLRFMILLFEGIEMLKLTFQSPFQQFDVSS